jgi:hypothetical protein
MQQIESLGFTAGSLAASIGVPRQQVDYAIRTGRLRAIKSGRRWIVLKDDALAWLKLCREEGGIPSPVTQADKDKFAALNRARREASA